jgi:2-amino-4-hydroxy-6-hydroxymethyldihydropteridine diphosphokinase
VGDEEVHEPDLEVPHPRLHERGFVLAPLSELMPAGAIDRPPAGWAGVRITDLSLVLP